MTVEQEEHALAVLADRLQPNGWTIRLQSAVPTAFTIEIDHALTSPHLLTYWRDRANDDLVRHVLARRELEVIASAPDLPHRSLIGAIRRAAHAASWPDSVVAVVARILVAHGLLTADEATWLEDAGPAWFELEDDRSSPGSTLGGTDRA